MRVLLAVFAAAAAEGSSPIAKVVELLSSLSAKVTAEGEREQQQYEKYVQWCEDNAKEKQHELKNSASTKENLEANVAKLEASISTTESHIEELASSISRNEEDLQKATAVRNAEHTEFQSRDRELADTVDTLQRALQEIKKQMAKGLTQIDSASASYLVSTVTVLLDGATVSGKDAAKIQAFLQSKQAAAAAADDDVPPALVQQQDHDGGMQAILQTFEDLLSKAEDERSDTRKAETEAQFNFEMLKQSLTDELKTENKELTNAKQSLAGYREALSSTNGDLTVTNEDAEADEHTLRQVQQDCMQTASDHELSVRGRQEELKALADAKQVIQDMTGGAGKKAYGLVQMRSRDDVLDRVTKMLRKLGRGHGDTSLALLASEVATTAGSGDDVFAKVKGLIRDMMSRILEKQRADADEHEWCEVNTAKTTKAKEEHEAEIAKLTSKADRATSAIEKAAGTIASLQQELAALAKMQSDMDANRVAEHADFAEAQQDYEQGIAGVQAAIKVLKDYYAKGSFVQQPAVGTHSASGGAATGVISLLEVCESDFSKLLAEAEADEKEAESVYKRQTKENKLAKAEKETSLKYTIKVKSRAEKTLAELKDDTDVEQSELDATLEYLTKVNKRCVAKPETYADRKGKRDAEIAGLKNALQILNEETAGSFLAIRTRAARK
mmetsp:Transcript_93015/g.248957  ORF Transcript_93015/g.248957 Transcript_93015/m.248957 type:complete len:672 (-) Transcript_93015:49-2064(-)